MNIIYLPEYAIDAQRTAKIRFQIRTVRYFRYVLGIWLHEYQYNSKD